MLTLDAGKTGPRRPQLAQLRGRGAGRLTVVLQSRTRHTVHGMHGGKPSQARRPASQQARRGNQRAKGSPVHAFTPHTLTLRAARRRTAPATKPRVGKQGARQPPRASEPASLRAWRASASHECRASRNGRPAASCQRILDPAPVQCPRSEVADQAEPLQRLCACSQAHGTRAEQRAWHRDASVRERHTPTPTSQLPKVGRRPRLPRRQPPPDGMAG